MDYTRWSSNEITELLLQLKCAGIDNDPQRFLGMWSQIAIARRVLFMNHTDIPWKKRKLFHLLQQKSTETSGLPSRKSNKKNPERSKGVQFSTVSPCPKLNSPSDSQGSSVQILHGPCLSTGSSESGSNLSIKCTPHNSTPCHGSNSRNSAVVDVVLILDSDDDSTCFNEWSYKKPLPQKSHESDMQLESGYNLRTKKVTMSTTLQDDPACGSTSSITDENVKPIDDSAKTSSPKKTSRRRSDRLTKFTGDRLLVKDVPVGNQFQANIPDWTGAPGYDYNLESSKWLGERMWPTEGGNMDTNIKCLGQGRSKSLCQCDYPESAECIESHIREERLRLSSQIGNAFYTWGFDKMGEVVSDSWTVKEENHFKKLFKRRTALSKESFWKRAFNRFPLKCRESIVSYYFNVFVLRNVRMQARLPSSLIDSDNDEAEKTVQKFKTSKRDLTSLIIPLVPNCKTCLLV